VSEVFFERLMQVKRLARRTRLMVYLPGSARLRPGRVPCPAVADLNPGGGFRLVSNVGAASTALDS
jgi:hypothetical protein